MNWSALLLFLPRTWQAGVHLLPSLALLDGCLSFSHCRVMTTAAGIDANHGVSCAVVFIRKRAQAILRHNKTLSAARSFIIVYCLPLCPASRRSRTPDRVAEK